MCAHPASRESNALLRQASPRSRRVAVRIALLFSALFLAFSGESALKPDVMAPGKYGPHFEMYEVYRHGWPATFLERASVSVSAAPGWRLSAWRFWEGVEWVSWIALLSDLIALGCMSWIVSNGVESAFRRWRFGTKLLFSAVAGAAVVCALIAGALSKYEKESAVVRAIEKLEAEQGSWSAEHSIEWERRGPTWLRAALGWRTARPLDRVVGLEASSSAIEQVTSLHELKVVRVVGEISNRQLQHLAQCPHLETLDLNVHQFAQRW
jgi:hypothetical protein